MRFLRILVGVLSLAAVVSAADLKVKVVDPQSEVVSGAQVILLNSETPVAVQVSPADGTVVFHVEAGSYQVKVLAPGFAPQIVDAASNSEALTVKLAVGRVSETVYVSAMRTPVPADAAGADTTGLNGSQLETMNPGAANDALRFLPGAIIATTGQHGGLSSLFVRGGES